MKRLMYVLIIVQLLTSLTWSYGQEIKNIGGKWHAQMINVKSNNDLRIFKVEPKGNFRIRNEGELIHWHHEVEDGSNELEAGKIMLDE